MNKQEYNKSVLNLAVAEALGSRQAPKHPNGEDLGQQALRRQAISEMLVERFKEKPLAERVGEIVSGSALTRDTEITAITMNLGLLGIVADDTLLSDIQPQGEGLYPYSRLTQDPLWERINSLLPPRQWPNILRVFDVIEKTGQQLEDEAHKFNLAKRLGHDSLRTVGDLRQVPLTGLESLVGLGKLRARLIYDAARIIDLR